MAGALTRVSVEPDDAGCLTVRWEPGGDHDIEIGLGPTPEAAAHTHVLRVASGQRSARLTDVPAGRQYVSVSCDGTSLVTAERRVRLLGAPNFRDLGGYPTASGGWTRWGKLYRSSSLHQLTPDDLTVFDALGVRAIYDLRRDDERAREPGLRPSRSLPMPTRFTSVPTDLSGLREQADGERWLFDDYRAMLRDGGSVFGTLLTAFADTEGTPAVFHCAGGKDRTGLSAALLLTWLRVDRDTILDDYELTGRYLPARDIPAVVDGMVELGISRAAAEGLLSAPRWAMAETLEILDADYDGIESYLRGPVGLSTQVLDDLRSRFVA